MTRFSDSSNGNGLSRTPLTTLNTAVFAPRPNARAKITSRLKPGFFSSCRTAVFMQARTLRHDKSYGKKIEARENATLYAPPVIVRLDNAALVVLLPLPLRLS